MRRAGAGDGEDGRLERDTHPKGEFPRTIRFCTSGWGCTAETNLAEVCYYANPNTSNTCQSTSQCNTGGYTGLKCSGGYCIPNGLVATPCWAYVAGTGSPNIPAGAVTTITDCESQTTTWQ